MVGFFHRLHSIHSSMAANVHEYNYVYIGFYNYRCHVEVYDTKATAGIWDDNVGHWPLQYARQGHIEDGHRILSTGLSHGPYEGAFMGSMSLGCTTSTGISSRGAHIRFGSFSFTPALAENGSWHVSYSN